MGTDHPRPRWVEADVAKGRALPWRRLRVEARKSREELRYLRAAVAGVCGSLAMWVGMMWLLQSGMAAINSSPAAALSVRFGFSPSFGLITHFLYGTMWAVLLAAAYKDGVTLARGIGLGLFLWLVMMLVVSPLIGWGVFGVAARATDLDPSHALYLGAPGPYLAGTLAMHVLYGTVVGWVTSWIPMVDGGQTDSTEDTITTEEQRSYGT